MCFIFLIVDSNGPAGKIKSLQNALDLILQTAPILKIMNERNSSESSEIGDSEILAEKDDKDDSFKEKTHDRVTNGDLEPEDETKDNDMNETSNENDITKDDAAEEQEMLNLLESRLQVTLRTLIKQCSSSPK